MSGTSVIGLQWGDEAKGKLVDLLAERLGVDIVVRYQGGANAGHTVVIGEETYKLHQIPSGILTEGVMNLITPGVVLNPLIVLQEIDGSGIAWHSGSGPTDDQRARSRGVSLACRRGSSAECGHRSAARVLAPRCVALAPVIGTSTAACPPFGWAIMVGSDFRQRIVEVVDMKRRSLAGFWRSDLRRTSWTRT